MTFEAVKRPVFAPWKDPDAIPLIRFEGVTKKFGEFVAIENLSLSIYEREFFALLGPSGCGKSTTLLMLTGVYMPTGAISCSTARGLMTLSRAIATSASFSSHMRSIRT